MNSHVRRTALVHLALALLDLTNIISPTNAQDDCVPDIGRTGDLKSVVLIIQTWEVRSSNFHFDDPKMVSSNTFNVPKDSAVSRLSGANVRFYGEEVCVAVTKYTEVEQNDGTTKKSSVCLKSCLGVGGGTRLDTYSGTFGRPSSTNPPCCYSGVIKYLRFSIPAPPTTPPPAYQCIDCSDCDGSGTKISTSTCNAGEKCFTLKLQKHEDSEVVTVKGCSHQLQYWGKKLYCEDQCKSNVRLWPDESFSRHYSVCVSCCSGDKCNDKSREKRIGSGAGFYGHNRHIIIFALIFSTIVIS